MKAGCQLIEKAGGVVAGGAFWSSDVSEGEGAFVAHEVFSLIKY